VTKKKSDDQYLNSNIKNTNRVFLTATDHTDKSDDEDSENSKKKKVKLRQKKQCCKMDK